MSEINSNSVIEQNDDFYSADTDKKAGENIGMIFAKIGIAVLSVIICLTVAVFGASAVICLGPSSNFKTEFVEKVSQREYTKFLAEIYLSDEEINEIVNM